RRPPARSTPPRAPFPGWSTPASSSARPSGSWWATRTAGSMCSSGGHPEMPTRAEVEVLPTREALMEAAAARFVSAAGAALRASGRFVVALAGGSTPKALYALLAGAPWAGRVDWSRVHVFWGDERCVPPDDPASNYRTAHEALLAHVPVSEQNVHRIRGEDDPHRAAAAYERVLREVFATPVGPPRPAPARRRPRRRPGREEVTGMAAPSPVVFLLDVDNTLIDNDRVAADLKRYLRREVGPERESRYWAIFEDLRAELGYADYLGALQ